MRDIMDIVDIVDEVEKLLEEKNYEEGKRLVCECMSLYPDSAEPHNLMGIYQEQQKNHAAAMKHFRAAYALDPTYIPARYNLDQFGSFHSCVRCAYREEDVEVNPESPFVLEWDKKMKVNLYGAENETRI